MSDKWLLSLIILLTSNLFAENSLSRPLVAIILPDVPINSNQASLNRYLQNQLLQLLTSNNLVLANQDKANFFIKINLYDLENRIVVNLQVIDSKDKAIIYSVQRLVFPGLLAEESLNEICQQALSTLLKNQERFTLLGSIEYALVFNSTDEGLKLWMGQGVDRFLLGEITEGRLNAPYFPFELGSTITLTAEKENRWPRNLSIKLTQEPVVATIEPLNVISNQQALLAFSPTRFGIRAGYRYFPLPDKFMIGTDLFFSLHGLLKTNALPVYHQELRFSTGIYLFFPEDHWIRIMAGLASSIYLTVLGLDKGINPFFDYSIEPIWLSFEWNQSFYTVFLELRVPYFLPNSDFFQPGLREFPWISLGGALKW